LKPKKRKYESGHLDLALMTNCATLGVAERKVRGMAGHKGAAISPVVNVISKAAEQLSRPKGIESFKSLATKFQNERMQTETREAYLILKEKHEAILKERAAEFDVH
jgi:hypothetical protein